MEKIKKTILRALKTIEVPCSGTTCHYIVPDLDVDYFIKINLTSKLMDIGFFDAAEIELPPPDETYHFLDNEGDVLVDDNNDNLIY